MDFIAYDFNVLRANTLEVTCINWATTDSSFTGVMFYSLLIVALYKVLSVCRDDLFMCSFCVHFLFDCFVLDFCLFRF